ncbi:MAG: prolipoprotein diacylglyceryl transferase [Candidatus Binatia bacterium]
MYPELFSVGPLTVYSFGALMALGFYVGAVFSVGEYQRRGGDGEAMWNFLVYVFIAGLVSSRVLSVFNDLPGLFAHPLEALLSGSGFVWYGGLIGGTLTAWLLARRRGLELPKILECCSLGLAIGQGIGRLGCHVAGDGDWGTVTDLPWGVAYTRAIVGWPHAEGVVVHPTPLYEAAAYGTVFLVLYSIRKKDLPNGSMFSVYLILSSLARFLVEFVRVNPKIAMGLSQAQFIAIALFLGGLLWLTVGRKRLAEAR